MRFKIISAPEETLYPGQLLAYHVHPILKRPLLWVSEITQVNPPFMFIDEQRYGPYRLWHHKHTFQEVHDGVLAEDVVDYIMPFGKLGAIIHRLLVEKQLKEIFDYRAKVLKDKFGSVECRSFVSRSC